MVSGGESSRKKPDSPPTETAAHCSLLVESCLAQSALASKPERTTRMFHKQALGFFRVHPEQIRGNTNLVSGDITERVGQ
jgi:hypothetical protein